MKTEIQEKFTRIREEKRILIVNLIRELLLDVVRHAKTDIAYLSVTSDKSHIFIRVEDMGVGFNVEQERRIRRERAHMGLFSIRERISLFGGDLDIVSSIGKGTKVTMKIPFDPGRQRLSVE